MKTLNPFLLLLVLILTSCKNDTKVPELEVEQEDTNKAISKDVPFFENKEAFFGEIHVHTSASMDAFIGGNRITPDDSYRFARGEEMMVNGSLHKLKRPLDFAAVSDHAEYLGETYTLMNPGTPGYDDPCCDPNARSR